MSLTDEMSSQAFQDGKSTAKTAYGAVKEAAKAGKFVGGAGVAIVLKIKSFTLDNVTKGIEDLMFKKTLGDAFMPQMVSMKELKEKGKLESVDEGITKEVMHYFDKYCQDYKIHYSAAINHMEDPPKYVLFMNSDDTNMIMSALKRGVQDYEADRKKGITWESKQKNLSEAINDEAKRESVEAKLSFFRDRIKNDDVGRDAVEKAKRHNPMSR